MRLTQGMRHRSLVAKLLERPWHVHLWPEIDEEGSIDNCLGVDWQPVRQDDLVGAPTIVALRQVEGLFAIPGDVMRELDERHRASAGARPCAIPPTWWRRGGAVTVEGPGERRRCEDRR